MNLYVGTLDKTSPFLEFGLSSDGDYLVSEVGYVPLTPVAKADMLNRMGSSNFDCGPAGDITIAGSSTVLPLAEAWAEVYDNSCGDTSITVEGGGSSSGAGRVCANSEKGTPVDIGDMSRDWKSSEADRNSDGYTMSCLKGDTREYLPAVNSSTSRLQKFCNIVSVCRLHISKWRFKFIVRSRCHDYDP